MSTHENEEQMHVLNENFRSKLCDLIEENESALPAIDMVANFLMVAYGVSRELTPSKEEAFDILYDMLEEIESDDELEQELLAEDTE